MISLDNLTVSYGGWTLFDNISFLINPKDRIGLVGRNGAGKTTLLRIITGEQQPTSGHVTLNGECTIGYLPQTMRVADTTTLAEETAKAFDEVLRLEAEIASLTREIAERTDYESAGYEQLLHRLNDAQDHYHILGGDTREADIEKTLLGLGFKRTDFGRATSEFSGGWRMRIELAKLLLRRPSIFLLDEPTNHLDIESIQWLEEYLKNYNGAVLLISHDRAFLDNVTNRTVELSLGKVTDYKVSYSKYVVLRAERRAQQMAAYENQQRMIEKTEEFIEKFRYKPTKSNQVQSRIKQLERLERLEIEEEDLSTLNIKFPPAPRSGQIVAEIDLRSVEKSQNMLYTINLPDGITNQTGVNEATVSIQFSGLSTREYTVDNFEAINVPEGMEVEIINASLTVRVRGAAGQISQLTGDDIKVVVDFSNAVAGTATYKASITFGEEFTAVGAVMGPYSVSATVKG